MIFKMTIETIKNKVSKPIKKKQADERWNWKSEDQVNKKIKERLPNN